MRNRRLANDAAIVALVMSLAIAVKVGQVFCASPEVQRYHPTVVDNLSYIDANDIKMIVSNHGSFAYDLSSQSAGLWFPKGTDHRCVFASGPWLGAKVDGEIRVAIGGYAQEYGPGIILPSGLPDDPYKAEHKVYKIVKGDTASSDYINWPVVYGAPVDGNGRPLILGDQTLWCVYNDADPYLHNTDEGSTEPLGVEIQQTTYAFDYRQPLGNTVFVRFKIINKGTHTLDSTYFSLWCDPDIGGSSDDYVGCDSALCVGFGYNATDSDPIYGSRPPCVGYDLLQGPLGDSGAELGMTSFSRFVLGGDPGNGTETYNLMRGLNSDGSSVIDPTTGLPARYAVLGDPVSGTGWLDSIPGDKRFMLNSGPFRVVPGDTQQVVVGIVIGQGQNRIASVQIMKMYDDYVQRVHDCGYASGVTQGNPGSISLSAYPNPARYEMSFSYAQPVLEAVRLSIYAPTGQAIRTFIDARLDGRQGRAVWDLRDDSGAEVTPGIYFLRMEAGSCRATKKVVLVR